MKNFKDLLSEVAQPKSPEEKAFKDQHKIELIKHPVAPDFVHTGEIPGKTKKERPADVKAGEDEKKYDGGAAAKAKPFKMPRNIDENKLSFKELIEKVSDNEELLESPQEEISMMIKQLHFICYASEEIMEYLSAEDMDPEEWWQNKLAQVFGNVKSLYAYAKGSEVLKKDIEQDDDLPDLGTDVSVPDDKEVDDLMNSVYEDVDLQVEYFEESFDLLSESKIDVDYIGDDKTKESHEKRFNVKISMHGDDMAFVSGDAKNVWKFAVFHYDGDKDDAADVHPNLAKEVGYEISEEVNEANFKPGSLRLKNGQTVKIDFKDVKSLNQFMKGLNPKNKKEMEDQLMKDKKGFEEILKFATQAGI
jgi:hypothetical protein